MTSRAHAYKRREMPHTDSERIESLAKHGRRVDRAGVGVMVVGQLRSVRVDFGAVSPSRLAASYQVWRPTFRRSRLTELRLGLSA